MSRIEAAEAFAERQAVGVSSKFGPRMVHLARELSERGATDLELADSLGIHPATLTRWKKKHPEFRRAIKAGRDVFCAQMLKRRRSNQDRQKAVKEWRCQSIVTLLREIRRYRTLTAEEKDLMVRATNGLGSKAENWRWSEHEDRTLRLLNKRRARIGKPRPFQRDDTVRIIADRFGRTPWAVYRRMERLRKCSRAAKKAKG